MEGEIYDFGENEVERLVRLTAIFGKTISYV